ncbi:MAG: TonB-dependent receptor [Pseudomonadota bacterium]
MRDITRAAFVAAPFVSLFMALFSSADDTVEEVVVTGDFRGRTVDEIPASLAILEQDTIEEAALQNFEELSFLVPNLHFAGGSNRARYFQLRGIGERSQYEGAPNPSVGVLIDDVDFSAIGGIAGTWDMERVEVLRGPQATRYGANALAGLIVMQSVAPTEEFDFRTQVAGGNDDYRSVGVAFGGPATETLGYRLSGQVTTQNGFRDNVFLNADDTNGRDERLLRGRLRFTPSDRTQVDATLWWVDQDNGYDAFTLENDFTTFSNRPGRDAQESLALGVRWDQDINDAMSLTSVTGIARSDITFSFDADWGNQAYWGPFFAPPPNAPFTPDYDFFSRRERQRNTLNHEFRLQSTPEGRWFNNSTDWLVGVYGLRLSEDLDTFDDGIFTDGTFPGSLDESTSSSAYDSTKLAVFAQLDFGVETDRVWSAGVRIERRNADYSDSSGLDLSPGETAVGGHLAVTQQFNDRLSGYASISRGYKMGGFNLGLVPDGRREFDAEFLWNLETGVRWQGDTASVAATVFFARRDDQQVGTSFQLVPNDPSTFVFFQDNAATGENLGLEITANWQPLDNVGLYANLGLLDVTFDDFVTPEVDLSGREQAHAPGYSLALGARAEFGRGWFGRVDGVAVDSFFFSNSHDEQSEAYELVHLTLGYERDQWRVTAFARNVFDREYAVRGFFFGNEPPNFDTTQYLRLGDRRQVGVSLDWRY